MVNPDKRVVDGQGETMLTPELSAASDRPHLQTCVCEGIGHSEIIDAHDRGEPRQQTTVEQEKKTMLTPELSG